MKERAWPVSLAACCGMGVREDRSLVISNQSRFWNRWQPLLSLKSCSSAGASGKNRWFA